MSPRVQRGHFVSLHVLSDRICFEPTPEGVTEAKRYLGEGDESDGAMWNMLEEFLGNGWMSIPPEDIGALTSAPILSEDFMLNDAGRAQPATDNPDEAIVYWHEAYAVESHIAKWADGKSVCWPKGGT